MLLAFVFAFLKVRISKSHTWTHTRPLKNDMPEFVEHWFLVVARGSCIESFHASPKTAHTVLHPPALSHRSMINYCASLPYRLPWKKSHDGQPRIHHSGHPTIHHSGHYRIHMVAIRGFTLVAIKGFTWWPSEDSLGDHPMIHILNIRGFTIVDIRVRLRQLSTASPCATGILPRMYGPMERYWAISHNSEKRALSPCTGQRWLRMHTHTSCHIYKPHRQSYRLRPRGMGSLIGTLRKITTTCLFDWVLHDSEIHTFELFLWTDWSYKNMWDIDRRQSSHIIMACIAVHERRIWPCYAPRSPLHYYMRWSPEVSNTQCEVSETQPTGWDPN